MAKSNDSTQFADNMRLVRSAGFQVADDGRIDARCGCSDCDLGVQPGHAQCEVSDRWLIDAEGRAGAVVRAYDDGAWHWFVRAD